MIYTVFVTIFSYVIDTKVRLKFLWSLSFNCFDPSGVFGQVLFKIIIFHVINFFLMSTSLHLPMHVTMVTSWTCWPISPPHTFCRELFYFSVMVVVT